MYGSVNIESLRAFVASSFQALGVSETASRAAANVLVFADQRGISSHGVGNLTRIYVDKIRCGRIDPTATPSIVIEDDATALLDGHQGLGLVVATQAMDLAIEKARLKGAAVVAVRNSTHFGSASFYSLRALAADMIGIAFSNLGSQTIARPPDGKLKMLGTNPLSIAAPTENLPPFSLDMSTTVAATGKLRLLRQRGEPCPPGWLVDDSGRNVTEPANFFDGQAHLQLLGGDGSSGGYKGYGLGLAVDVLAGLLPGADVGPAQNVLESAPSERENIGHLFIAIDIIRFRPVSEFREAMDRMLGALLDCPPRSGCAPVVYPGYPEAQTSRQQRGETVRIHASDIDSLSEFAAEVGLKFPEVVLWEETSTVSSCCEKERC